MASRRNDWPQAMCRLLLGDMYLLLQDKDSTGSVSERKRMLNCSVIAGCDHQRILFHHVSSMAVFTSVPAGGSTNNLKKEEAKKTPQVWHTMVSCLKLFRNCSSCRGNICCLVVVHPFFVLLGYHKLGLSSI